jgi:hypothetical protein
VSSLVIFFPVVGSDCPVRMCRDLVEFGGPLVRIIWHAGLPSILLLFAKPMPGIASKNAFGKRKFQQAGRVQGFEPQLGRAWTISVETAYLRSFWETVQKCTARLPSPP